MRGRDDVDDAGSLARRVRPNSTDQLDDAGRYMACVAAIEDT